MLIVRIRRKDCLDLSSRLKISITLSYFRKGYGWIEIWAKCMLFGMFRHWWEIAISKVLIKRALGWFPDYVSLLIFIFFQFFFCTNPFFSKWNALRDLRGVYPQAGSDKFPKITFWGRGKILVGYGVLPWDTVFSIILDSRIHTAIWEFLDVVLYFFY